MAFNFSKLAMQDIMRFSPDGYVIFDTQNIIHYFNKGAEEIFGYKAEEVAGKPIYILIPEDLLRAGELERLQFMTDKYGRLERCCVTRLHKNGARLKLELTRSPIMDEKGYIVGYEAIFRDITKNIEFEKELRLTEKIGAVNKLVNGLAHELGTPLNIIHGHAELVLGDINKEHPHHASIQTILSACQRMTALIKSLRQFASQKTSEQKPVFINKVIEELLNFLRIQLRKQKIEVQTELSKDISPISGDKTQIEEIFLNVLMNSIQAMENGGMISIKTLPFKEEGMEYVATEIADNGPGISPDTLPRIFEPFFTTKEVGKGSGLGLYITHNLVQRHRGRISIEDNAGSGTVVRIHLLCSHSKTLPQERAFGISEERR